MYAGIKTAIGPIIKKTAPLRSKDGFTVTKRADQTNRWIEHFFDLHGMERPYTASAIDNHSTVYSSNAGENAQPHRK